jgi:hypothetical protein
MALEDVSAILKKEFVELKLDFDRGIGAKDIQKRYTPKDQGLPWFAFIDGDGQAIVTSTNEKGNNVGMPWQPDEVAHFRVMLEKLRDVKRHLTDADVNYLIKSIEDYRRKVEGGLHYPIGQ